MASTAVRLYSYWRSSCSWRVRIALALKGVRYEYAAVHLVKDGGEQHKAQYAALNPSRAVPTLVVDGHTIAQSTAIIEYLDETRPTPPLLPRDDAAKRALARQLALTIGCDIQPVQNLRVLLYQEEKLGGAKKDWGHHFITLGFESLEAQLAQCAGKYCIGDELSLPDVYLVPQVYNANRFGVDMSRFPIISRVHDALVQLDAFKEAAPDMQPDAPPPDAGAAAAPAK